MWECTARSSMVTPFDNEVLPERLSELGERIASPHIVDENVQAALLPADPLEELLDLLRPRVVDTHVDAFAAPLGDMLGGLFDRFRPAFCRRFAANAATGAVDGSSGLTERARDPAPRASGAPATTATFPSSCFMASSLASFVPSLRFREGRLLGRPRLVAGSCPARSRRAFLRRSKARHCRERTVLGPERDHRGHFRGGRALL